MCGEHCPRKPPGWGRWGSSPHVRGARRSATRDCGLRGIIPACAGSTGSSDSAWTGNRDHPRMCGEHCWTSARTSTTPGSSPHVRGALLVSAVSGINRGIIPACAGSTRIRQRPLHTTRDHPRMCGEHVPPVRVGGAPSGSSPHVRGALGHACCERVHCGIIPACAGSTPALSTTLC